MTAAFRFGLLGLPVIIILLGAAGRYQWLAPKLLALLTAVYIGGLVGTTVLYASTDPVGSFPPTTLGLVLAAVLGVVVGLMQYGFTLWLYGRSRPRR